jgi:hypothetical protein
MTPGCELAGSNCPEGWRAALPYASDLDSVTNNLGRFDLVADLGRIIVEVTSIVREKWVSGKAVDW